MYLCQVRISGERWKSSSLSDFHTDHVACMNITTNENASRLAPRPSPLVKTGSSAGKWFLDCVTNRFCSLYVLQCITQAHACVGLFPGSHSENESLGTRLMHVCHDLQLASFPGHSHRQYFIASSMKYDLILEAMKYWRWERG